MGSVQSTTSGSTADLPTMRSTSSTNRLTDIDNHEDEHKQRPSTSTLTPDVEREKRRIVKNILLISVAFLFNFNAFQGLSRLQSTLNRVEGMGVITLSVLYATLVVSCMFAPKLLIRLLGHRWTIAVSFSGYILYMAANGYAVWSTMIPTSVLVGLFAAPLWTAQCSYFTIVAQRYSQLSNESQVAVVSRFFGIFFMFFQASSITGSIISATVLRGNTTSMENADVSTCGVANCPWSNSTNPNLDKPPESTVWLMVGIYIGIACLAVLIVALFVDNLPKESVSDKSTDAIQSPDKVAAAAAVTSPAPNGLIDITDAIQPAKELPATQESVSMEPVSRKATMKEIGRNLAATFVHLRHPKQLLIIPLTMYSGFEQAAFNAEFSQAFVGCGVGMWKIGLVTLPYGVANVSMSLASGHVVKYTGRLPMFVLGMLIDLSIQLTLMFWMPSQRQEYVLYILATLWGMSDAIWQTQINTLYSSLFSKESEAAFSNYRMWESLGFIVAFAYSFYLCAAIKLYILTSMLAVGMVGYFTAEYLHWTERSVSRETRSNGIATERRSNPPVVSRSNANLKSFKSTTTDDFCPDVENNSPRNSNTSRSSAAISVNNPTFTTERF